MADQTHDSDPLWTWAWYQTIPCASWDVIGARLERYARDAVYATALHAQVRAAPANNMRKGTQIGIPRWISEILQRYPADWPRLISGLTDPERANAAYAAVAAGHNRLAHNILCEK